MKRCIAVILFIMAALPFAAPPSAEAGPMCPDCRERRPYGDYCPGPGWGWYGAKRRIDSAEEARRILQDYFSMDGATVGKLVEREGYYEADILDRKGGTMDRVIVDKRNGRIRSIY
jgi:hypothetical protein